MFYISKMTNNNDNFDDSLSLTSRLNRAKGEQFPVKIVYSSGENFRGFVRSFTSDSDGDYILLETQPRVMHQFYSKEIRSLGRA